MSTSSVKRQIQSTVQLLSEFFPENTVLYFPLLSSALTWMVRGVQDWKEKIFSWEIYLDPSFIAVKSDEFIQDFFSSSTGLAEAFHKELEERNREGLRDAFYKLYPILGLEDPFLKALFHKELEIGDYRRIISEFDARVCRAKEVVESVQKNSRLISGLRTFASILFSEGIPSLFEPDIQKAVLDVIKKIKKEKSG